jgi:aminocarboxymuconate-semialdehyde decarboxylase
MPHVDASLAEIERALDHLGMAGVAMTTSVLGRPLVDPAFEPIFEELDRRSAVLYLHPVGNAACSPLIGGQLRWMIGAPIEDTIAAAQLIVSGILTRHPNMKIVNAHLGGALPMLLQRMDDMAARGGSDAQAPPSAAARRMWYDTVGHGHRPALRCAIDSFGSDRLVLGTDYPYERGDPFRRAVDYVAGVGLDDEEVADVLGGNAGQLFGSLPATRAR